MQKKLIILDRDGVLNHDSDNYIKNPDEWLAIKGSAEAVAKLNQAGYMCVVATNQSGIARELYSLETFMQINHKMLQTLKESDASLEFVLFCPHHPDDNCECRKPKSGMLLEILSRLRMEPDEVYFVGDTLGDIQAANNANIKPILVRTGKGEKTLETKHVDLKTVAIYDSLADFTDQLLAEKLPEEE